MVCAYADLHNFIDHFTWATKRNLTEQLTSMEDVQGCPSLDMMRYHFVLQEEETTLQQQQF